MPMLRNSLPFVVAAILLVVTAGCSRKLLEIKTWNLLVTCDLEFIARFVFWNNTDNCS